METLFIVVDLYIICQHNKSVQCCREMHTVCFPLHCYRGKTYLVSTQSTVKRKCARNLCQILSIIGASRLVIIEAPNIRFHENLSSGSRAYKCRHSEGQT